MLTVDLDLLGIEPGNTVLDMGCGGGRHAFAVLRRGADVVAFDADEAELKNVLGIMTAMVEAGEVPAGAMGTPVQGDALALPFDDGAFDRIIAAEVIEHIPDDVTAIAELARVLAPGGRIAVTVPARFPERINWALDSEYHDFPGGHIRIYSQGELEARLAGCRPAGAGLPPRARPALALLVDQVRGRRQRGRPIPREEVPRPAGLADHEEPPGAARSGSGAQPGHRQEPDRVRGEAVMSLSRDAARADGGSDRLRPGARRPPPVGAGRQGRSVEHGRGRDGPRRRRAARRSRARVRVAARSPASARWLVLVLRRRRGGGPDPRHQHHRLPRHRRVASLPVHG